MAEAHLAQLPQCPLAYANKAIKGDIAVKKGKGIAQLLDYKNVSDGLGHSIILPTIDHVVAGVKFQKMGTITNIAITQPIGLENIANARNNAITGERSQLPVWMVRMAAPILNNTAG